MLYHRARVYDSALFYASFCVYHGIWHDHYAFFYYSAFAHNRTFMDQIYYLKASDLDLLADLLPCFIITYGYYDVSFFKLWAKFTLTSIV